jgi:hypothetical protein
MKDLLEMLLWGIGVFLLSCIAVELASEIIKFLITGA